MALAMVLAAGLALFVYAGTFSRFIADDYCSSNLLRHNSFWEAQWLSYTTWSNRYATMLVTGLVDPLDVAGIRLLPAVLISGLLGALYWLLARVRSLMRVNVPGPLLFVLAELVVYISLYTTPNLFQSYYWRSGNITYALPAVGLVLLLAVLLSHGGRPCRWWQLFLIGMFSFLLAGFSETNAAFLTAALFLGTAACHFLRYRQGRAQTHQTAWTAALAGALAGLLVVYLSPGNAVRMKYMPDQPAFFDWIGLTFRYAYDYLFFGISSYLLPRAVSFTLALALAVQVDWRAVKPVRILSVMGIGVAVLFLLVAASCAPSVYAQHAYPEDRALTTANILLSAAVIGAGFLTGVLMQGLLIKIRGLKMIFIRQAGLLLLLLLSVYLVYSGTQLTGRIEGYRGRAEAWDERAEQIEDLRQAGEINPRVQALDSLAGLQELSGDADLWVNRCAAGYYEVESMTAE